MKWLTGFIESLGFDSGWPLVVIAVGLIYIFLQVTGIANTQIFAIAIALSPLWLPLITFLIFFDTWVQYVQKHFLLKQGRVMLEVRLPQEIFKSPQAMELILPAALPKRLTR